MLFVHALKNAAVPIVTMVGIGVALLIGGAVVTESVFAIPGLGRLTVDAILRRDYPVIQGVVLLFSFMYVLVNLVVDLLVHGVRPEDPLLSVHRRPTSLPARACRADPPDALPPVRSADAAVRAASRPSSIGAVLLVLMVVHRAVRALARHRSTRTALAPAKRLRPPSATLLVRHRHARPRRLFAA